jgi:hypothetical protein
MSENKELLAKKDHSQIEGALAKLEETISVGKRISGRLHGQVFASQPLGTVPINAPESEKTLVQIIYGLAGILDETNERLDEVYKCLSNQLGNIKLD